MKLDFTWLDNMPAREENEMLRNVEVKTYIEQEAAITGSSAEDDFFTACKADPEHPAGQRIEGIALAGLTREQEEHRKLREAYSEYQENISRSGRLRGEILKGIKAGDSPQVLLLKAVKCISLMTGDRIFYQQAENDIKAIHGEALQDAAILDLKAIDTEKRLQRLREAYKREDLSPDSRKRIERAIRAHEDELDYLRGLILSGTDKMKKAI